MSCLRIIIALAISTDNVREGVYKDWSDGRKSRKYSLWKLIILCCLCQVVYLTATVPFIIMFGLMVRSVHLLNGSRYGFSGYVNLYFLRNTDINKLRDYWVITSLKWLTKKVWMGCTRAGKRSRIRIRNGAKPLHL